MRLRLIDLDGNEAWDSAATEFGAAVQRIDCRDLGPRLRLWTTRRLIAAFAARLDAASEPANSGPVLTLFGAGDYHHLTTALLKRIHEPFTLIHFDNHPDWVRLAPRYHCGSWINRALELPLVMRIVTLGPCSDDLVRPELKGGNLAALGDGRLELYPWRHVPSLVFQRLRPSPCFRQRGLRLHWRNAGDEAWSDFLDELHARIPSESLWFTIDKDVLQQDDAATNWDQGEMPLEALLEGIRRLGRGRRVLGADICGDYSPPHFGRNLLKRIESRQDHPNAPSAASRQRNPVANRAIIGALQEVMT